MDRFSLDRVRCWCLVVVVLAGIVLLPPVVIGQAASELLPLSFEVFGGLQQVYKVGQAPSLVEKFNKALELIGEAESSRLQSDDATAASLDEQARTILNGVSSEIPSAQEVAQREVDGRTFFAVALIPAVVLVSTLGFYVSLVTWRRYERMRLFEMTIVEGKKVED